MGKSLAQLLTSSAVLMAVGLAAVGGGKGLMCCRGAVDARRRGGGGLCGAGAADVVALPLWLRGGSGERCGFALFGFEGIFAWEVAGFSGCCGCPCAFTGGEDEGGLIAGVGGADATEIALGSPLVLVVGWEIGLVLMDSGAPYR